MIGPLRLPGMSELLALAILAGSPATLRIGGERGFT
jgi:hypothetical protein